MKTPIRMFRIAGIAAIAGLSIGGLLSNSSIPAPTGYTGSPADGKTCGTNGGCHGGGATVDNDMISSDIPADGYTPGSKYNVTVTVAQAGVSKFGFSFTAQKNDGAQLGTLAAGAGTSLDNTSKYISHTSSSTAGSNGSKAWSFKWTAPASGTGVVSFYAAGNATDAMSNTSGDNIYKASATFIEKGGDNSTVSINNKTVRPILSVYPNPAKNVVWLDSDNSEEVRVINLKGELFRTVSLIEGKNRLDISDLNYGVYRIQNTEGSINETLVKL